MAPPPPAAPPYSYAPLHAGDTVSSYLGPAIAAVVVGFLCGVIGIVPGIVSLVMATRVKGRAQQGDVQGAHRAARAARVWAIVTFVLVGIFVVMAIVASALDNGSSTS